MLSYIDLKYKPGRNDLIIEYYLESRRFREAVNSLAGESSIDTWSDIKTMNKRIFRELKPSVFRINKNRVKIAYPLELFEKGNVSQVMSSIAGNVFGLKMISNLRLEDVIFPKKMVKWFKGPKYGIKGVRKLLKIKKRPLIGTIIKPKLGLNYKEHAKVAYDAWLGGVDCVKDDENLTSMEFNPFNRRIVHTLKMKEKAERETGEKKAYMPNVTSETFEMLKRMEFVEKHNGNYIMVDILTVGFSGLQTLRDETKLPIHAHRAMHAALTRNKKHGISMLVLAKLARLIGVDTLHIGTIVGKMEGGLREVRHIEEEIEKRIIKEGILTQRWYGIKPVMAVASGGLHPGMIEKLVKYLGKDILMNFGGGIHGHPAGTLDGAMAVRQAVDAVMKGENLKEYAERHIELKVALKKFGFK